MTSAKTRSINSWKNVKSALRHFFKHVPKPISEITINDVDDYLRNVLDKEPLKLSSKECRRFQLAGFFTYVELMYRKQGIDFRNPIPSKKLFQFTKTESDMKRVSARQMKILDKDQLERILEDAYNRGLKVFLLMAVQVASAPRISETRTILKEDLNLKERYFETGFVRNARKSTMNKDEGLLFFFPPGLVPYFEEYLEDHDSKWLFPSMINGPFSDGASARLLKSMRESVGFYFSYHYFRRTLITERMKLGCPLWVSEGLQNHAPSSVEGESYIKLTIPERRDLYDKYFPYKDFRWFYDTS